MNFSLCANISVFAQTVIYVCMHIHMHVCAYVHMYACVYACMCVW